MSVASHGPGLTPPGAAARARRRVLLRRLMVRCPVTGLPTDTGFELSATPDLGGAEQLLVDCLECGQDHRWAISDAFVG